MTEPRRPVRRVLFTVLAVALRAAVCLAGALGVRRVVVEGPSMLPTLRPGDRLLAVRWGRARVGDLVVVADPRHGGRLLVKRVTAVGAGHLELSGDNPAASTDSRSFGPVGLGAVRGRVVRRYAPAHRAGPVL
ncbi:MAG: nickel-type superoxide dismutase maturation protease [Acidimicrobiales bacterium]